MPDNKFVRALFPGSFDPITNGHLDVIQRGKKMFDQVIVAIGDNVQKDCLFTGQERLEMIQEQFGDDPEIKVVRFTNLTVECAKEHDCQVILRGLRNLTDVQYEFQLAMTNRAIAAIETVFIMTSEEFGFTSSTLIREVGRYGGDISRLVPDKIYKLLTERLNEKY
ncbi:MAG: pantetheine-phosphate adenylyltransferase [Phycisphaerae bacterium]|nr:pantetheine-phosphate adenylyltransferase [Phycisphaerae bacterium]